MFENIIEASKRTVSRGEGPGGPTDETVDGLSETLVDDETAAHVLTSLNPIQRIHEGRAESIAPRRDGRSFLLATDRRVLFVADDGALSSVDIAVPLAEVDAVVHRSSLLESALVVETVDEERISISPSDGDAEAVGAYIERTAESWREMGAALDSARETLETYRDETDRYEDPLRASQRIRGRLALADDARSRYADTPSERLAEHLRSVAAELADALHTEAERLTDGVHPDDEGATAVYEQARGVLEHARQIAVEHADADTETFDESMVRFDEAIERSRWVWGET
ncbi:hypothetical protein NDI85_12615 [Halomicroarcula sp. S1AR25-4]|uniref:hypothetical protein n=1 Tax=Haloarcula sp. S1AR25-4 TaxID=2950538 RepID=UPI0028770839|nr:hypothetical protein [Halomicroarcula sp. S1AR25-4]MDS0278642.1 hypothetical protein [Halomicroarcula sp. S1AR25-4]